VIPHVIHRVWLGENPLPTEFAGYGETWLHHNPGWELRLWTEMDVPTDLRRPEAAERLRFPAERADILRLEILWREGGVYVDTDFECIRPIGPLLAGVDFFVAFLKPHRVNNAIIGSVPGHALLSRGLTEMHPVRTYGYDKSAAGPLFVDSLVRGAPGVVCFPAELFYPSSPAERENAVALHHAARSWKDAEGFVLSAGLADRRVRSLRRRLPLARARRRFTEARLVRARARVAALRG